MRITVLFLLLMPLRLDAQSGVSDSTGGYRIIKHTSLPGRKAQIGDYLKFYVDVFIGDSLMSSTRKQQGPKGIVFPEEKHPVYSLFLVMSEGDSASVFQTIDSSIIKAVPLTLRHEKEIRFDVMLLDIENAEDYQKRLDEIAARGKVVAAEIQTFIQEYHAGNVQGLITNPSGLLYKIIERGDGAPVHDGDMIKTYFYGCLTDGTVIDNSFDYHEPILLEVGNMAFPGLDEGLKMLTKGSKAYFVIPPEIAFGSTGFSTLIPPDATLVYFVDILK